MEQRAGFVYLLHFQRPISPNHSAQHYLGFAQDLAARIQAHQLGHGARLTQVARERGIRFKVARVWRGSRVLERRLKGRHEGPRLCPICGRPVSAVSGTELTPAEIEQELRGF